MLQRACACACVCAFARILAIFAGIIQRIGTRRSYVFLRFPSPAENSTPRMWELSRGRAWSCSLEDRSADENSCFAWFIQRWRDHLCRQQIPHLWILFRSFYYYALIIIMRNTVIIFESSSYKSVEYYLRVFYKHVYVDGQIRRY